MIQVDSLILLYACRYALKRKTPASQEVSKAIRDNLQRISSKDLKRLREEIEKNMDDTTPENKFVWKQTREELTEEILIRARIEKLK